MAGFSVVDYVGLAFFALAWLAYHAAVEFWTAGRRGLNPLMNEYRHRWMEQMVVRDNRVVDTTILASLQNGTAFFASTSLFAVGGVLALFQSTDTVLGLFAELPLGLATTRFAWEIKVMGLAVIFVYAFFKFAWSYRLFNYVAILVGSVPVLKSGTDPAEALAGARLAGAMNVVAGRHFNRGQRAFFFALAYLGWFVSAYVFMAATAAVLYVMWRRQFASDARLALLDGDKAS
ncbi:MAG TPA: DUF599 family protein [Microvirga sp.]|nr:DUF599 family protein [Microvirga sp.]